MQCFVLLRKINRADYNRKAQNNRSLNKLSHVEEVRGEKAAEAWHVDERDHQGLRGSSLLLLCCLLCMIFACKGNFVVYGGFQGSGHHIHSLGQRREEGLKAKKGASQSVPILQPSLKSRTVLCLHPIGENSHMATSSVRKGRDSHASMLRSK